MLKFQYTDVRYLDYHIRLLRDRVGRDERLERNDSDHERIIAGMIVHIVSRRRLFVCGFVGPPCGPFAP